jgi:hypothetical protein
MTQERSRHESSDEERTYTAFADGRRVASGTLPRMLLATKKHLDAGGDAVLVFEDWTGRQVDFDFRGRPEDVLARATPPEPRRGPGRPRLGVVSREVSLLPRHWEWLEAQPNGISAALRRLVDQARKHEPAGERARAAREAAGRFLWAIAGNLPRFEEASRALYAGDVPRLRAQMKGWPRDIRAHALRLEAGGR